MTTPAALLEEAARQHLAGNAARATALYQEVLTANPNEPLALANLAALALDQRDYERALELASTAIEIQPDYAQAWNTRGVALTRLNKPSDAVESYDLAISAKPTFAEAYSNRAGTLLQLSRVAQARADCEHALALRPDFAAAHATLAAALCEQRHFDAAVQSYERAIALAPKMIEAHNGLGVVFLRQGRAEEALAVNDRVIAHNPASAETWNDRGAIFYALRRYDDALASYDKALSLFPNNGDAYWNKSLLLLLLGRYEEGWKTYEWRWRSRGLGYAARNFAAPLWNGEDLTGKVILLHAEQGLGDAIQFARYVPLVAARGGNVVLEVPKPLAGFFSRLDPSVTVIARGASLPQFDVQCPLMSLPMIFETTVDTIPAPNPYLSAEPKHLARWRSQLGARVKPRVGLTWAGRPGYANDFTRSMSPETLAPLLEVDCEFHCLHRDITLADRAWLDAHPGVRSYGEAIATFEDAAALASLMDVIVTVDTATAHLAGALGKPTDILLPYAPDFRWLTDRNDSPWYPTAQLFRQSVLNDWSRPLAGVKAHLQQLVQSGA